MLMKPGPIFEAVRDICSQDGVAPHVIFFSPCGRRFDQSVAEQLAQKDRVLLVAGRYEGMDERVYELADQTLSLGDFVLTGGELAALAVVDATVRLLPGALGDEMSAVDESFAGGLLEYEQYTRPAVFEGRAVPEVLLSGDHARIAAWRRRNAIERTALMRPDLLLGAELTEEERAFAEVIVQEARMEDAHEEQ